MILGMTYEMFLTRIPAILIALTIHELAHGWTALRLGDPTARDQGRITLNPIAHLDLLGTLMLLSGLFGWAKPVPVNPYNLRRPKRDLMLISLAGPLSNIALALCCGFAARICYAVDPQQSALGGYLAAFLIVAFMINSGLAFFNLLPLNPLDGSKILAGFLPDRHIPGFMKATSAALPVIFGLVMLGYFTGMNILGTILGPVFKPFMFLMQLMAFGDGQALMKP